MVFSKALSEIEYNGIPVPLKLRGEVLKIQVRLLMSSFLGSLYILEIRPFSDVELVKIFSHSVGCLFILMTVSFVL